ncbi:MAG: hypothetical protein K0U66_03035 [Gammaproteobacteria bacterium]|nr:hypothetical protein [Gammaproteobacteria bacterium]
MYINNPKLSSKEIIESAELTLDPHNCPSNFHILYYNENLNFENLRVGISHRPYSVQ